MILNTIEANSSARHVGGKPEYTIYSDLSRIAELSRQWNNLLESSHYNKAFGSMEWYLASCRVQGTLLPYVGVAVCGAEISCILPLALNPDTGVAFFPHLENDYNDILMRDDNPNAVVDLLKYALSFAPSCRQITLSKLRPDSNCLRAAAFLNNSSGIRFHSREIRIYHYIELPSTLDDYLASRGKLFRRNVRRALRNQDKSGLVVQELYPEECNLFELPEIFIRLILSRHSEKCEFRHEYAQSFVREVLPVLFRNGSMRVFAIFEKQQIVAIDLYLATSRGLVAWNGGFLAEIERTSPGTTLIGFAIKQALAMGLQELDLGEGDEAYKRKWTNSSYPVRELVLTPAVLQEQSNGNQD